MRRPALLALVSLLAATALPAQSIWVGGGPTFPTGDYGNYAKTGWMASAGVGFPLGEAKKLAVQFEGLYGSNSHSDVDGDKTNLYGGLANLNYRFGDVSKLGLYVYGGAGLLVHDYKSTTYPDEASSDSKFAYQFGAGLDIPLGGIALWIDAKYLRRAESYATALFPLMAGISIPIGKN
jgi:hypothetical protein